MFVWGLAQGDSVIPVLNAHGLKQLKRNLAAAAVWGEGMAAVAMQNLDDLAKGLDVQREMVTTIEEFGSYSSLNQGRWVSKVVSICPKYTYVLGLLALLAIAKGISTCYSFEDAATFVVTVAVASVIELIECLPRNAGY